ncbi:MAG: hypothetical protein IPJ04_05260 [Candidatus Eisenbacteria bacterium]|nr:hypothetical protein [Candidatus Eisenbacteria bacterium]
MKKIATIVSALMLVSAVSAYASGPGPFYAPGDYVSPNWTPGDPSCALSLSAGVWSGSIAASVGAGTYQGKVAVAGWSESYPASNVALFITGSGESIAWTFDTNTYADGWLPATDIVLTDHSYPAGITWEAIGAAPETGGWGSGVAMTQSGNIWSVTVNIASVGSYDVKWRKTGDWSLNVGTDGVGTNANNFNYTTTVPNQPVTFQFNQATGRSRIVVGGVPGTSNRTWGQVKSAK